MSITEEMGDSRLAAPPCVWKAVLASAELQAPAPRLPQPCGAAGGRHRGSLYQCQAGAEVERTTADHHILIRIQLLTCRGWLNYSVLVCPRERSRFG